MGSLIKSGVVGNQCLRKNVIFFGYILWQLGGSHCPNLSHTHSYSNHSLATASSLIVWRDSVFLFVDLLD